MADALSPEALAICAHHWRKHGAACGTCPLREPCTSPCQPLTAETLAAWRGRLNAAAALHEETRP